MKVFVIFAIAFLAVASAEHHDKPDYHWRDFDGTIPFDALEVAQEGSDEPVYIGQGYFDGVGILPGMLKKGKKELVVAANGRLYNTTDNIKIFAPDSKHPQVDFQWIKVHYQHLDNLMGLHFLKVLVGGTESSTHVYIGRHSESDYTNIGKIYTVSPYQGLTIPDKNGKVVVYKNFEVLAMLNFDCDEDEVAQSSEESNENSLRMMKKKKMSRRLRSVRGFSQEVY